MLQFIIKTGKVSFWLLFPLFLISNTGYELPLKLPVENGKYRLKASGIFDKMLTGHIVYKNEIDSLSEEIPVARLELKLGHTDGTVQHRMGFVISKQVSGLDHLGGTYRVNANAAGLSNNFDGIFGFADIGILGEQPFFTDYGTVHLDYIENGLLHGNLNITLQNFEGKKINLFGNFIAVNSK